MKTIKRNTKNTAKIVTIILLVTLLGAGSIYALKPWSLFSPQAETNGNSGQDQSVPIVDDGGKKEKTIKDGGSDYNGAPPADIDSIVMSTEQQQGSLILFTKLYGYSDGVCTLRVTSSSYASEQSASVGYQPEYSTCAGFSISIDQHGTGIWQLELTVTSKGTSVSKVMSVDVK